MDEEEQRRRDEEARAAADAALSRIAGSGLSEATSQAAGRTVDDANGYDESGIGPITIEPADAPVEEPTRDHMGRPDPSSGSVFGPDYPDDMAPGDPPDAGPVLPGRMRNPEPARALASPVAPPDPEREAQSAALARMAAPMSAAPSASASSSAPVAPPTTIAKPPRDPAREAEAGPARGLDYGLPTEQEISAARGNPLTDILHGLQNGLLGAAGRPLRDFGARADALAEERRSGIRAGLERKGLTRRQESQDASAAERQTQQDELAQQRLGLEERRTAATEAMIPSRIASAEATTERTQAQTKSAQLETMFSRATREERQSAESEISRGYQQAVATRAELTGIAPPEGLEGQSAEQLEPVLRAMSQGVGVRRGRGGGSPGPSAMEQAQTLAEQYVAHGISEDLAQAQAEIAALGGPDSTSARQRLASRMDEDTPPPPTGAVQANIAAAQGAADEIQQLIARSGRDIPGIGRLDALVPTIALSEEGRRMRALVLNLSDNYLRMVSGAAIPEHEIESFAERLGASDEPIFREQVARIQREIARRQTGSASSPATAAHRRPRTQAPDAAPAAPSTDDFSQMSDEELRALAAED